MTKTVTNSFSDEKLPIDLSKPIEASSNVGALKPVVPVKRAPAVLPINQPTLPTGAENANPLPDFRAALSSVIRAQTSPQLSTKTAQMTIARAHTVPETSKDSSKPEKLTHPNKGRSKGPKRRLPKDTQKTASRAATMTTPSEESVVHNTATRNNVSNSHKTAVSSVVSPVESFRSDNLQPPKPRKAPPPKGRKPDFKTLNS